MYAQIATVSAVLIAFVTFASPAVSQTTTPEPRVFTTILVVGNDRFRDGDILATSGLQTGVPLGQEELLSAVEALEFTGEFKDVAISSSGQTLTISVHETPAYSGGLTFGAGYDSDFGLFGAAGLSLNNAFGNDTQIRSNLLVAEQAQTLGFQIRSDSFWSQNIKGGVRLAYENYDFDNTTFDFTIAQIEPYVVFDLSDKALVELRYTLASKDISDVDAAASPIILDEAGRRSSSGIGFSVATGSSLIVAENPLFDAWTVRFDQDFTGLGGDTDLSQTKLSLFARKRLSASGLSFRTTVEIGAVNGLSGDQPRASERFTLGGSSLRGFERGTISPRDVCAGCSATGGDLVTLLGGDYYAVMRNDLLLPLFKEQASIETFLFFDVGGAWSVDTSTAPAGVLDDERNLRSSAGVGASFDTSLGKFEAYLSLVEDSEQFDELQAFGLTFRSEF